MNSISFARNITILLIITIQTEAQKLKKGFYISPSGVQHTGLISVSVNDGKPQIIFKESEAAAEINLPADSVKSYSIGKEIYKLWFGKRQMVYIDESDFTIKNLDSSFSKPELVALKLLVAGDRLSLYHFKDVKDHFFVEKNGELEELLITYYSPTEWEKSYQPDRRNPPTYMTNPLYRQQLNNLLKGELSEKLISLLFITTYDKLSLSNFFKRVNK